MILEAYKPGSREEVQDAIKDVFGPIFEAMLQGEMEGHLGYASNDHGSKETDNRRNGYIDKSVKTSYGAVPVSVPRDRDGTFEPQIIPKRSRDVSGIEDKVLAMYAKGLSQRDIAEMVKDIFTAHLKKIYGAPSLTAAEAEFERFRTAWSAYPGAVDVWARNWVHVARLFNYGSAVRKVMYTTNAIESVNSSFRKVTKKGAFPNQNALLKLLYLRVTELYQKWDGRPVVNWAMVGSVPDFV